MLTIWSERQIEKMCLDRGHFKNSVGLPRRDVRYLVWRVLEGLPRGGGVSAETWEEALSKRKCVFDRSEVREPGLYMALRG